MMGTTWGKKTEFVYEMMWLDKNFTLHNKNTHWKDFYFAYDHNIQVTKMLRYMKNFPEIA